MGGILGIDKPNPSGGIQGAKSGNSKGKKIISKDGGNKEGFYEEDSELEVGNPKRKRASNNGPAEDQMCDTQVHISNMIYDPKNVISAGLGGGACRKP